MLIVYSFMECLLRSNGDVVNIDNLTTFQLRFKLRFKLRNIRA